MYPMLFLNELMLGNRVPTVFLVDKASDLPIKERTYVPCPHCGTIHDFRTWSNGNGTFYWNWFGYYCPKCGNTIPCIRNWTSQLLIIITFPLWFWWRKALKGKWLKSQPRRFENLDFSRKAHQKFHWRKYGLQFGMHLYVGIFTIWPIIFDIELSNRWLLFMLVSIPFFVAGGLFFGYAFKLLFDYAALSTEDILHN